MNLTLFRGIPFQSGYVEAEGTPGFLKEIGFYTLEKPWRDNQVGLSRIPAKVYQCAVAHMNDMNIDAYQIQNVEGRDKIFIHFGNWAGDETQGWYSDVEGCILIGGALSRLVPGVKRSGDYERAQLAVVRSVASFKSFMQKMAGQPFTLTIIDPTNA